MEFGDKIKALRESRGYMQKDVAGELGIAPNTLSGYERGLRKPDSNILKKIAHYYGVSVDDLLEADTTLKALEQDMPEGITALRRLKKMDSSTQKKILEIINTVIDVEEKSINTKK